MAKRLFLLLFSSFIGIFCSPDVLMASDSFDVIGLDNTNIVETIPIVEEIIEEKQPEPKKSSSAPVVNNYVKPATYSAPQAPQILNYTVTVYRGSMDEYNRTATNLSDHDIYKFRKMIYAHNSWNLLGSLNSLSIGSVFTITEGGVAKNYQVMEKVIYQKTADGNLENSEQTMRNILSGRSGSGVYHVALMTCTGQSLGHGDATHRLVVFANAI